MKHIIKFINRTGEFGISQFRELYAMVELFYDTVTGLIKVSGRRRISVFQIINQVLFTGVDAFLLVGLIGLLCGITISIQAMTNMPKIGIGEYFGNIMVIALIRELGPFFTSLVVIGRSGAALAAYIGNMRVTKEISALEAMGVNLTYFLVMPAFIGMIISLVCLNIYFDIIGIVGGLILTKIMVHIDFTISIVKVIKALTATDILLSVFKNVLFGATIAIVSCHHGLSVHNIRIVPRAVFRAVVGSMVVTMLINVLLTVGFYVG